MFLQALHILPTTSEIEGVIVFTERLTSTVEAVYTEETENCFSSAGFNENADFFQALAPWESHFTLPWAQRLHLSK